MRRRNLSIALASALALPSVASAQAAGWPNRPVRLIVPFGPGGFTDVVARILGQKLSQSLGQQFVVENRPGAGSTIGTDLVAKAPPDGYTLVMISATHTIAPSVYKSIPYDPIKSFTPISRLVDSPYVLLAHPKVAARNVQELVAQAKAQPNVLHYSSSGNGSSQHLMGGLFESLTGAPLKHVPYRSSAGAANDLVAGVVELGFAGMPNALAHVPTGRLKALAVTTSRRAPQMPEVPTMQEAGVRGYEASVWLALLGPAGLPQEIVTRLNAEIVKLMAQPDTRKALFDAGVEASPSTPQELVSLMQQEMQRWGKVVRDNNITME